MGLNEQPENGKRWNYAPKKKWKECYMSIGHVKEEAKELHNDGVSNEKCTAESVADTCPNVTDGQLTSTLTSSPKHNGVACNSNHVPIGDWSVICKPEKDHCDQRTKLHYSTASSGPLAGLRGALQAHSDEIAQCKSRIDGTGVYAFKAVDQKDSINVVACGPLAPKGRLSNGFIPSNGVIHTVNQVAKELCSVKDELGRKRISMTPAAARDASLRSTPSREVHNKLEKNRRAHLKECFELLRTQLPSMEDKKISNQTILKAAFRYIQTLKRKERELEHEMERLARAKIALQQNVSSLKKELQSKYDHMDFSAIMPDSTTLEQMQDKETKSTTTASEQPDYEDRFDTSDVQMSIPSSPYEPEYGDRSKQCVDHDYDQPLNLSTAQVNAGEQKSLWEGLEGYKVGSRIRSMCKKSSMSKCVAQKSTTVYKEASNSFLKEDSLSTDNQLIKEYIIPTRVPTDVASSRVAHISLPTVGAAITPLSTSLTSVGTSPVAHFPQIFKSGASISQLPPMAKVMTAWPSNHAVLTESAAVISQPQSFSSPQLTVSGGLAKIPNINGSTITRVSTDQASFTTTTVASTGSHTLPMIGASGLHIPAQLVTNNVHLSTHTGGIISQQAIQVFTPEGYKLVSSDGAINGSKPVTILAQTDGLENFSEDGKTTPFVVSVNKNGLSAFHLAMPSSVTRTISANSQGATVPMTSLPLNLTVGGAASLKVTQAGSASILPSYIPLATSNGIARLLPGMSVMAPLVMSSSQRGVVIPTVSAAIGKTKTQVSNSVSANGVPLLPAQYASTLTGGLVNSVVVVSAAPTAVPSSNITGKSNNW